MGFLERLKAGLRKTRQSVFSQIAGLFRGKLDEDVFDELEELLIAADVGVETTMEIMDDLRARIKEEKINEAEKAYAILQEMLLARIGQDCTIPTDKSPTVILMIGVNGVGKTTSVAKIAHLYRKQGKKVLLCAADTFRAAAAVQLAVWAERAKVDLIRHQEGSDPAAVVFDAIAAAKNRGTDVLIIDTAGRLHNKKNLMDELAKINRVIARELPDAHRESLLVLDATTGQNAISQAKEFQNAASLTGLVLTKLDGTAKGGIVFSIQKELAIPVYFICVGEQIDDLQPFCAEEFVRALFEA